MKSCSKKRSNEKPFERRVRPRATPGACPECSRRIRRGMVEGLILSSDRVILLD